MRIRFNYKNYPLSKELTAKSQRVGTLTHPIYGLIFGALPGVLVAMLLPGLIAPAMILLFGGAVAGPLLLNKYRKKKFAEYDAEYEKLLKAQNQ